MIMFTSCSRIHYPATLYIVLLTRLTLSLIHNLNVKIEKIKPIGSRLDVPKQYDTFTVEKNTVSKGEKFRN